MDFVIGFFVGGFLVIGVVAGTFEDHINISSKANKIIEQCQKDLPRDQYCTIIAVPNAEIEED